MKVLLISYYFQPVVNARSIRWLNFCIYLKSKGKDVDILTIRSSSVFGPYVAGAEKLIPENLNVVRTHPGLLHHLLLKGKSKKKINVSAHFSNEKSGFLKRLAKQFWKYLIQPILIPDHFIDWVPIAFFKGVQLSRNKQNYDVIISSSNPLSGHLVGYLLKLYRPNSIWIAEYGDPWSFFSYPKRSRISDKIHYLIEKTILKKVDYVVATTQETCDGFLKHFKYLNYDQVVNIPQGTDTIAIEKIEATLPQKFTICYIGRFDPIRDPKPLFESFRLLIDNSIQFEFIMAGPLQHNYVAMVKDLQLGPEIKFLGQMSHNDALRIAKSCHVLLYYGNNSSYQLPSKLWEYLALRRPILCVGQVEDDIGANIIRKYNRGVLCKYTSNSIAESVTILQKMYILGELEDRFSLNYIDEADWRNRAAILEQLIHSCVLRTSK